MQRDLEDALMCKKRERSSRCLEERENNCDNFCSELMNTGELSCFSITLQRGLWVKYTQMSLISQGRCIQKLPLSATLKDDGFRVIYSVQCHSVDL